MAMVSIKGPDGVVHKVNMPEGATREQAVQFVAAQKYGVNAPAATPEPTAPATPAEDPSFLDKASYLAGGINKGLLDIADLPAQAVNAAAWGLHLPENFRLPMPSSTVRDIATQVPESIQQADTPALDTARTGTEWGAGIALPISKVAKIPDLLAAGGAMIGEELYGDTGEIAGGLTGALSPIALAKTAPQIGTGLSNLWNKGKNALTGTPPPQTLYPTPATPTAMATTPESKAVAGLLRANASDKELLDVSAGIKDALARGEVGTATDLSRSPNIATVENAAMRDA